MVVFEKEYMVQPEDIDELDHVNNVRYLDWVQTISEEHWNKAIPAKVRKDWIWVVRKHTIEYHLPSVLGQTLRLRTYIKQQAGPISTRIVEVLDNKTGKKQVTAITDWCLLDAATLRPRRVPESIAKVFTTS
ncbi:MAG: acyl-CoA thioesterase [Bacteroidota bacterium]